MASEDVVEAMMRGPSFDDMRQRIRECLMDPETKRFSFNGWEGVGKSVFLRQVIDEFSKQAQRDYEEEGSSNYLYKIVWVEMPGSVIDLRKSIWKAMGNQEYTAVGERRIIPMPNQKILLVLDYLQEPISLNEVGTYDWQLTVGYGSKVVITSPRSRVRDEMKTNVDIQGRWEDLSEDEAWDLVCAELTNLANSIATSGINIGRDNIVKCFSYLLLFAVGHKQSTWALYWTSEGFIGAFDHFDTGRNVGATILAMLKNRAMIKMDNDAGPIVVSDFIRSKVVPIINRGGGFLVRCDLKLEEAPIVEEWEKENLKMISLAKNNIRTLAQAAHAPVVPHLSTLILSSNPLLCEIPDDFFQNMQGLRVLDLSYTGITSLPSSLSSLTNLRLLNFSYCPGLDTLPLPLLHALQKLEVLLLGGSSLPKLTEFSLDMMQNIYFLDISDASNLTQLSLRGCSSFECLIPPENLEMLDLSSTKIRDFSDFRFTRLKRLSHLDLSSTKHLKVVPWHWIDRLPQTLNWHEHSPQQSPAATQEELHNHQGYCISVSDHEIFQTLSKDSKLWDEYFKRFKFSIVSSDHRRQQQRKDADNCPFERNHFIYRRIYAAAKKTHFTDQCTRSYDKRLEIEATNDVPSGIGGVLYHTEFFSLHNNNSITRLSQLGIENMDNLLECRIERCKNMQSLFITGRMSANVNLLNRLENLLVFDLPNLKSLCRGTYSKGSFACLKHIYLEKCPRLLTLFSSSVRFEKLEFLEIRFCDNLVRLFEEDDVEGQDVFPQLKELFLFKLRKLKCICNGNLPALEELKVHGCRSLQKLPLPVAIDSKLNAVVIGDDQDWKKHLKWEEQLINPHVRLKVPRSFKI